MEGGSAFLIHDADDVGVACLGVRDGGEHCRQVRDELLGVEVRLLEIREITRRSNRRVLLREVGLDAGCVVACELEGPKSEVHGHTSRALPAGIEPSTPRVAGCCSTNSTNDPYTISYMM